MHRLGKSDNYFLVRGRFILKSVIRRAKCLESSVAPVTATLTLLYVTVYVLTLHVICTYGSLLYI